MRFEQAQGTVESPKPIEAASLSFCSDSLRSNCARYYSLIRKDGCNSHEQCSDFNLGPDTSHFQTHSGPSSGSKKQLPACACTRSGALRYKPVQLAAKPSSVMCLSQQSIACRMTLIQARLLPSVHLSLDVAGSTQSSPGRSICSSCFSSSFDLGVARWLACLTCIWCCLWGYSRTLTLFESLSTRVQRLPRNIVICLTPCRSFRCSHASLHTCGRHWH